jgi:hypothetical protein
VSRKFPQVSSKVQHWSSKFPEIPANSRKFPQRPAMLDVRDMLDHLRDTHTRDRTLHDSTKKEKSRRFWVGAPTLPLLPGLSEHGWNLWVTYHTDSYKKNSTTLKIFYQNIESISSLFNQPHKFFSVHLMSCSFDVIGFLSTNNCEI